MAHRELFVGDVVAAIWAQEAPFEFDASPVQIQAAFRRVAEKYPELLGEASFGPAGGPVNSPGIKAALDGLAMGNYVTRRNPDLSHYQVGDGGELAELYEIELAPRLSAVGIEKDLLKEAAEYFKASLNELSETTEIEDLLVL